MTTRRESRRFWLGVASSVVFLWMAVRRVDWQGTMAALGSANWPLVTAGALALLGTWWCFAWRWRLLLGSRAELPVRSAFSYIAIGYLVSTVLPLRLGDVARAVLAGRRSGAGASLALGTIVVERLLDVFALLVVASGVSLLMEIPALVRVSILTVALGGVLALALLVALARSGHRVPAVVAAFPRIAARLRLGSVAARVARFAEGLAALRSARRAGAALALSLVAWGLAGLGMAAQIAAFHLATPWYAGLFLLVVINLGASVPSSPGYVGVYHYLAVLALSVWVPARSTALAFAIGTHAANLLLNVATGVAAMVGEGLTFSALRRASDSEAAPAPPGQRELASTATRARAHGVAGSRALRDSRSSVET